MSAETENGKRTVCLVAGCAMMLVVGLLYAWSIFRIPLSAMFPLWKPTQLSVTFTVSIVFFCLGGFFGGKLAGSLQTRYIFLLSAAFFLAGFGGLYFCINPEKPAASLILLYVLYGVFCGTGVGLTYNANLNAVVRWFPGKTGVISGVLLMCFGLGGLALGSVVTALIKAAGLRSAFLILGVGVAAALAAGSFFVAAPAAMPMAAPDAMRAAKSATGTGAARDYTTGEMLKTPVFWLFCVWNIGISTAGLLIINSAAVIAVSFNTAALLGLLVSVCNGIGRVSVGALFDRKGRHAAMLSDSFVMLLAGVLLIAGALSASALPVIVGMLLVGVSYGGAPPSTAALVNKYFGQKHYAVNLSVATFGLIPGAIAGPLLSSRLQEISGGSYTTTFVMLTVVALAAIVFNFALRGAGVRGKFESKK